MKADPLELCLSPSEDWADWRQSEDTLQTAQRRSRGWKISGFPDAKDLLKALEQLICPRAEIVRRVHHQARNCFIVPNTNLQTCWVGDQLVLNSSEAQTPTTFPDVFSSDCYAKFCMITDSPSCRCGGAAT